MASWTDKIPTFNPYVAQLPVEAMVTVGMEKQKRYDEGIQKIQTSIDNVAGLDIVRDVDKNYLQSKLNQLGNDLKGVAAGDFSNFQLVNSVNGMTNQLVKDRNVQNAVGSSARYRKEVNNKDSLNKEGKGSPSNDWLFNKEAGDYLNSQDLNASYTGSYNPYTNYRKNALDVIKNLTGDSTLKDDAFTVDAKGNLVISDAITRTKLAGIPAEKVQEALLVGLTPADFKQMEIDGRYNYSNIDDQTFANDINSSFKAKYDGFAEQRRVLANAIDSTNDATEKIKLKNQVDSLDKVLKNVTEEYNGISKSFANGDVESAKARLHTNNFINGFSKAFSHTETSQTVENNPYADIQMRREVKDQDWKKFTLQYKQDEEHFRIGNLYKDADLKLKGEENDLKRKELEGYGGLPSDIPQEDLPKYTLAKVVSNVDKLNTQITNSDNAFMADNGEDKAWLDQQRTAWMKSPGAVDPLVAQHFNNTESLRRKADADQIMINEINATSVAKHGDLYSKIPKDAAPLRIKMSTGDTYTVTPKEFVDFNETFNSLRTVSVGGSTGGAGGGVIYNDAKAKGDLSPKQYELYKIYKKNDQGGLGSLNNTEKVIIANAQNYRQRVNVPYRETIKTINEETAAEVTRRLTVSQGVDYTIPTNTTAQKSSIGSLLTSFANLADKQGGALANSPNWNSSTARKIATDGEAKYNIKVVQGTSISPSKYEITATGNDGKVVQFNMTPEQKISAFGESFEGSPAQRAAQPYLEQLRKMSGSDIGSTGFSKGKTTVKNSFLGKVDFPSTNIYGVSGNVVTQDGVNYSVRVNIYNPITKKIIENIAYPRTGLISSDQIVPALMNLGDADIYELINGTPATANDLQKVKQASKKPL